MISHEIPENMSDGRIPWIFFWRFPQVFEDEILDAKIAAELMGEAPVGGA